MKNAENKRAFQLFYLFLLFIHPTIYAQIECAEITSSDIQPESDVYCQGDAITLTITGDNLYTACGGVSWYLSPNPGNEFWDNEEAEYLGYSSILITPGACVPTELLYAMIDPDDDLVGSADDCDDEFIILYFGGPNEYWNCYGGNAGGPADGIFFNDIDICFDQYLLSSGEYCSPGMYYSGPYVPGNASTFNCGESIDPSNPIPENCIVIIQTSVTNNVPVDLGELCNSGLPIYIIAMNTTNCDGGFLSNDVDECSSCALMFSPNWCPNCTVVGQYWWCETCDSDGSDYETCIPIDYEPPTNSTSGWGYSNALGGGIYSNIVPEVNIPEPYSGTEAEANPFTWTIPYDFCTTHSAGTYYIMGILGNEFIPDCPWSSTEIFEIYISCSQVDAGEDQYVCEGSIVSIEGITTDPITSLEWTTYGDGTFGDPFLLQTTYVPGPADIATGYVILTLSTNDNNSSCVDASDYLIINIEGSIQVNAGSDIITCGEGEVELNGIVEGGGGNVSVVWSTNGDGYFENEESAQTSYIPGETDINNGFVILTLTASDPTGICNPVSSDVEITIIELYVDAGTDQTICFDEVVALNGVTTGAESFTWSTSGDGTFENSNGLQTTYFPGTTDINNGLVILTLTATESSGNCDPVSSSMLVIINNSADDLDLPESICESADPVELILFQNGINGNWLGPGVINNVFVPSGLNGVITITFTPDAGQCAIEMDGSILVQEVVIVAVSGIPSFLCENEDPVTLLTNQDGVIGQWSGPGVMNDIFNPYGQNGNVTITFTPDDGQCAGVITTEIQVNPPLLLTITGIPESLCRFNSPISLPVNQSGVSGNWSGLGVTNSIFNPSGLNGNILLTFTPDPGICALQTTISILVFENTYIISGIPPSVCVTDPPIQLPAVQNGIMGNWSGSGVSNNTFNPNGQNGIVTLTFTPNVDQCASPASQNIFVSELVTPLLTDVPSSLCESDFPIILPSIESGYTGSWSGMGVTSNTFNPNGLSGNIALTFTPFTGQCAVPNTITIDVSPVVTPLIAGIPSEMCGADFPVILNTNQDGITGNWSGPGVMNNVFDPEGLSGTINVIFTPDNPCALIATADIIVFPVLIPLAVGLPDAICQTDNPLPLPEVLQQIPGNWSGAGVSNNMFNPNGQNGNITLTFIPEPGQCAISVTTSIVVSTPTIPIITGVPTMLCQTDSALLLPEVISGITGNWSGQNVVANVFTPVGLNGNYTFLFSPDAHQCAQAVTTDISIHSTPAFINLIADCDSSSQTYTVSFDIIGGETASYMVNGIQVGGTHYTSPPILSSNTAYHFTLNDVNGCGQVHIEGNLDCSCATFAGTMIFPGAPLKICEGSDFSVAFNGNAELDPDDILGFVLHDQAGTQLGTIYAMSDSAAFAYPSGIVLGQTYYVSPIAGSNNGIGGIDMLDPCLSVSQGIPVIFYSPEVILTGGGNICPTECITYDIKFSGEKPFEFNYRINLDGIFIDSTITSDQDQVEITICPSNYNLADGVIDVIPLSVSDANCMIALTPIPGNQTIVYPEITSSFSINLCPGQTFVFNETIYDQLHPSGVELLQAVNGCDSLVEINVYYYAPSINEINQSLCFGGSLEVNGTEYNESHPAGSEVIPGGSVNGCDSIIIVDLSFNSFVSSSLDSTLCPGESIQINGNTYDESNPVGSELFPGASVSGCDSMVNIELIFFPTAESEIAQTICKGEWIVVNGTIYDEIHSTGVEVMPNSSVSGCDSTVIVNLSFYPEARGSIIDTLEAGESIVINGTVYNQSNAAGVEVIHGGSVMGCDSIIIVALHFNQALSGVVNTVAPICHGESTGQILVEAIAGGIPPYLITIDGGSQLNVDVFPIVIPGLPAGTYSVIIEDQLFNIIEFNLEVPEASELNIDAGADLQAKEGKDVQLNVNASFMVSNWSWSPVDFLSCTDCSDPKVVQSDRDIIYTVTATDEKGCEAFDDVRITILPEDELYVPTIFSPNRDGVNDTWRIYSGDENTRLVYLSILDRWGGVLFNCADRLLDDPGTEWDGTLKGSDLGAGVYVFVAEVKSGGKTTRVIKGDITLIR